MAVTVGKQTTNFNITPIIGVDISNTYPVYAVPGSSATQTNLYYPENSNPQFALGTHVFGTNESEYVLCVVATSGSINQYDLVTIDQNYNVAQTTSATGTTAMLGFNQGGGYAASQSSVTVNFCWIALRGDQLNVNSNAAVTVNSGAILYIGTAPGTIGTASASTVLLVGVNNPASVTAATTMAVIAQWPRVSGF
jgi:hypothetical protein